MRQVLIAEQQNDNPTIEKELCMRKKSVWLWCFLFLFDGTTWCKDRKDLDMTEESEEEFTKSLIILATCGAALFDVVVAVYFMRRLAKTFLECTTAIYCRSGNVVPHPFAAIMCRLGVEHVSILLRSATRVSEPVDGAIDAIKKTRCL